MAEIELSSADIIIAIMGGTGSGKSTFIQPFTQIPIAVGQGLESCTASCEIYKCSTPHIPEFYMIDTPGFDDIDRSMTDVLREIAWWLSKSFSKDVKLTGIIFMHRISDRRWGGATAKSTLALKNICGQNDLGGVVLVTTFHNSVTDEVALRQEEELKKRECFWGHFMRGGSRMFRHDNGKVSAERVVDYLTRRKHRIVLELQLEMVEKNKPLNQTAAGIQVQRWNAELARMAKAQLNEMGEDMEEALASGDKEWQRQLKQEIARMSEKLRQLEEDNKRLQVGKEELWQEQDSERNHQQEAWQSEIVECQRRVEACTRKLENAERSEGNASQRDKLEMAMYNEQEKLKIFERRKNSQCIIM